MTPSTHQQWFVQRGKGIDGIGREEVAVPQPGDYEVLIQFHAVSLNYRDVMIAEDFYMWPYKDHVVPCSDGAGEVIATGPKVTRFQPGHRVTPNYFQNFIAGTLTLAGAVDSLGGVTDGVLRQYGVYNENGLVSIPANLSYVEAATLPCAAVTAWNCLFGSGRAILPGDTVVTQGTGGVSVFALQFAVVAGAQVIATTSSVAKGEKLKELGAAHVINYMEDENWGETAKKLSLDGRGADCVIEIGGPATMGQSIQAAAIDGEVAVVGSRGRDPKDGEANLADARSLTCRIRRILVGSRLQFEQMNKAIAVNDIKPVVDARIFRFEEVKEALHYLADGKQLGKIVIEI